MLYTFTNVGISQKHFFDFNNLIFFFVIKNLPRMVVSMVCKPLAASEVVGRFYQKILPFNNTNINIF